MSLLKKLLLFLQRGEATKERTQSWSSLVEGDEQLYRPNSHQNVPMDCFHVSAAYFVWIFHINNSLSLGPIQPSSPSTKELLGTIHFLSKKEYSVRPDG